MLGSKGLLVTETFLPVICMFPTLNPSLDALKIKTQTWLLHINYGINEI